MQLSKVLLLTLTLAVSGLCLAQPVAAPKKETDDEFIARFEAEHKAEVISDFQKALREKFKLSDADVSAVQLFIARQDAQLHIVQNALYQVTLAADDDAKVSDEEYAVFWNDFQTLLAKYRAQKTQDGAKLGEQLHLDQNLRLRSFLTMRGIIGDELSSIKPMSEVFQDSEILQEDLKEDLGKDKPKRVVPDDNLE